MSSLLPGHAFCECEHAAHFPEDAYPNIVKTPNGNHAHNYGAIFLHAGIVGVRTPYGVFHVCRDCAGDCYQNFPQVELRKSLVKKD